MIRTFLAAALVSLATPVWAQSSVTLFGVVDTNLTYGKGSLTSLKAVGTGGLAGSRVGFRGVEDLGGGLRAAFVIEHGMNTDTGVPASATSFWNRQTYVALGHTQWGELQLGRIYTPTFLVHATYDAFGPQGTAAQHVLLNSIEVAQPANIRANNAANYNGPANLGGVVLQAMVSAGEAAPGKYQGLRVGYAAGAFAGDAAIGRYDNPAIGDLDAVTVGARYKIGELTLYGLVDRADSGNAFDTTGMQFSGAYQLGPTALKASIAQSRRKSAAGADAGTSRRIGIGAVHDLSRRTALYTSLARVENRNGSAVALNGSSTAADKSSSGIDVGIRHAF